MMVYVASIPVSGSASLSVYGGTMWESTRPLLKNNTAAAISANTNKYCNICNPFPYDTSIMANAAVPHGAHSGHGKSLFRHRQRNSGRRFFC